VMKNSSHAGDRALLLLVMLMLPLLLLLLRKRATGIV
jgi:hypothetical protein